MHSIYEKGFFHLLGANSLLLVFGFISQLFVAWILTPEEIGTIKILQTYVSIFVILGSLGYNVSVLKLCSEKRKDGEKKYLFQKGLNYSFIGAIAAYLIIIIFSFYQLISIDNKVNLYMIIFGLGIFPQTVNTVYFAYLQALKKIQSYSKIQVYTKIFSIIIVIVFSYYFILKGYIISIIVGYLITNVFMLLHIKKINKNIDTLTLQGPYKLHNKYSFISLGANLLSIIIGSIDILLMNYFIKDRTAIGYYSFAVTFASVMLIFSSSIMQVTSPYFSEVSVDFDNWLSKVRKYDRLLFIISVVITLLSLIAVPLFLKYIFHGKYQNSIKYFELLAIAWFFKNLIVIKSSALFGIGKININTLMGLIALPIYFISIFIGIHYYNLKGAAYSMIISSIFLYILQNLVFNKVIKNMIPHQKNLTII